MTPRTPECEETIGPISIHRIVNTHTHTHTHTHMHAHIVALASRTFARMEETVVIGAVGSSMSGHFKSDVPLILIRLFC